MISLPPNGGLFPRLSDKALPPGGAVVATNVDLRSSLIEPIKDLGSSVGTGSTTIYLDRTGANPTWMHWDTDVDVVQSPISPRRTIRTDGTMPKIRDGISSNEYNLAVPTPASAPTCATYLISNRYVYHWHWFYEETTGVRADADHSTITPTTTDGVTFTLASIPARVTAPSSAQFIMWCQIYDANGFYYGQVIPSPALAQTQSDAALLGVSLSGSQVIASATATFTVTYDTSRLVQEQMIRGYVYTWVRNWADLNGDATDVETDESAPSPLSAQLTVDPSMGVTVTIPSAPPSGYGVNRFRIYRTVSGTAGTALTYVGEGVVGAGLTYSDSATDSAIASQGVLPTSTFDVPPATLVGVKCHPSGFLVGFSKNVVYFSEPYQPHAWPDYSIQCDYNVVCLGIVGQTIIVATEGNPLVISGNSPLSLNSTRVNNSHSGTGRRAIVDTGDTVIYATPVGLVEAPGGRVITEQFYTVDQWQALDPSTMQLAWSNRRLFVFTSSGAKIFRLDGGSIELTEAPDVPSGFLVDMLSDTLYLSISGGIYPWGAGSARNYAYQTKTFISPTPIIPSVCRLTTVGNTGTVVMSLYGDGNLCYCEPIPSGDAFWLPVLPRAKQWSVKVTGNCSIRELIVSDSMRSL